jgi:ferredoxin
VIIAEIKRLEEIKQMLEGYKKVLIVGCGGCTSICLAGGQKEVENLNTQLTALFKADGVPFQTDRFTVERQCEVQFLAELDRLVQSHDAILSMGCGAGVQFVAERYPEKPVFPALNSVFVGVNRDVGWYEERCKCCGDCVLGLTGGICPVAMCAKGLLNGPCGGPRDGHCEVDKDTPCAWIQIYERLKAQGRLENISKVYPAREWEGQIQGSLVLDAYKHRYTKKPES